MVTEDYVSCETAKLLKEKGFDEITFTWYTGKGKFCVGKNNFDDYHMNHFSSMAITAKDKNKCSAPTLQTATKWIQETFNIVIIPNYEYECDSTPWCYKIFKLGEGGKPERVAIKGVSYDKDNNPTEHIVGYRDYERSYKDYSTKEEAIEDGIRYCLENLV